MKKSNKRLHFLLLLYPIGLTAQLLAMANPAFAEYVHARVVYRFWRTMLHFLSGLLPFSLAELILIAIVPVCLGALLLWVLHMKRCKPQRREIALRGLLRIAVLCGIALFLFIIGSGENYYRPSYAETAGIELTTPTHEELAGLCSSLADRANKVRSRLTQYEDTQGVLALPYSLDALKEQAVAAMTQLGNDVPQLSGSYEKPKTVLASKLMSKVGITGFFFPFTMEANVNVDYPVAAIGASMCHELVHVAGLMREEEANYLAYLACTRYGDDTLSYSGLLTALLYAQNALYEASPQQYAALCSRYSDGLRRDLAAYFSYWSKEEGSSLRELGDRVNDLYLKANGQAEGVASYDDMVYLLVAEYRNK